MGRDYKEDLRIRPERLDEEWLQHAQKFMDYAVEAAEAEEERNRAKQFTQTIRAKIAKKIRARPKKYGLKSLTEKAITAVVEDHPKVKRADQEYYAWIKKARILEKAEHAMGSYRKSALEHLTSGYMSGFFKEPRFREKDFDRRVLSEKKRRSMRHRRKIERSD